MLNITENSSKILFDGPKLLPPDIVNIDEMTITCLEEQDVTVKVMIVGPNNEIQHHPDITLNKGYKLHYNGNHYMAYGPGGLLTGTPSGENTGSGQNVGPQWQVLADANVIDFDLSKGINAKVTVTDIRRLNITNGTDGVSGYIVVARGSGNPASLQVMPGSLVQGGSSSVSDFEYDPLSSTDRRYVDYEAVDDSGDGTTEATAKKTIAGGIDTWNPAGRTILLKRGPEGEAIYTGQWDMISGGQVDKITSVTAYGVGYDPIWEGGVKITGTWTNLFSNVWRLQNVDAPVGLSYDRFWKSDEALFHNRYPAVTTDFFTISANTDGQNMTVTELNGVAAGTVVGARAYIKTQKWNFESVSALDGEYFTVTSQDAAGNIVLDRTVQESQGVNQLAGREIYFELDPAQAYQPNTNEGQVAYDPSQSMLLYQSKAGEDPNTMEFWGSCYEKAVVGNTNDRAYVLIENIHFRHQLHAAVDFFGANIDNCIVRNCTFTNQCFFGVKMGGTAKVWDCTFDHVLGNCVEIYQAKTGAEVLRCTATNTGLIPGLGGRHDRTHSAFTSDQSTLKMMYNNSSMSGGAGFEYKWNSSGNPSSNAGEVAYNYCTDALQVVWDMGYFYFWGNRLEGLNVHDCFGYGLSAFNNITTNGDENGYIWYLDEFLNAITFENCGGFAAGNIQSVFVVNTNTSNLTFNDPVALAKGDVKAGFEFANWSGPGNNVGHEINNPQIRMAGTSDKAVWLRTNFNSAGTYDDADQMVLVNNGEFYTNSSNCICVADGFNTPTDDVELTLAQAQTDLPNAFPGTGYHDDATEVDLLYNENSGTYIIPSGYTDTKTGNSIEGNSLQGYTSKLVASAGASASLITVNPGTAPPAPTIKLSTEVGAVDHLLYRYDADTQKYHFELSKGFA